MALCSDDEATITAAGGQELVLRRQDFELAAQQLFGRLAGPLEQLGSELFVQWAVEPSRAVPSPGPADSGVPEQPGSGGADRASHPWVAPPRRITRVVLVGQMCRLPSVQQFVRDMTGLEPQMTVDPAHAVALGAAIQVRRHAAQRTAGSPALEFPAPEPGGCPAKGARARAPCRPACCWARWAA